MGLPKGTIIVKNEILDFIDICFKYFESTKWSDQSFKKEFDFILVNR